MSQYTRRVVRPGLAAAAVVGLSALLAGCAASASPSPTGSETSAVVRPAAPDGELSADLQADLQSALDETMSEYAVPGAAVGVWIPGEGSWTTTAGLADIEGGVVPDVEMMWPLRSVTKSYTITLLLQLVDEGSVSLDDTIGEYVEGVTDGDEITLRELAGMSSGNADYTNPELFAELSADEEKIFTLDQLNSFMLGKPAQFAPGASKVYTNANTNLLGAVIESVTGQEFAEVLDERILTPLGQQDTRYLLDAATWTEPHAIGYARGDGGLEPQLTNNSIFGPAGSLITSLDDARVWADILATGALVEEQTQVERLEGAPLDAGPPYDVYALGIGETMGWWGHNGEGTGFTAAVFHEPESGASIVVFMNESNVVPKAHPADQTFRRMAEILETGTEG